MRVFDIRAMMFSAESPSYDAKVRVQNAHRVCIVDRDLARVLRIILDA